MTAGRRLVTLDEDGASVTVPPGAVAATALGLARLLERALIKGERVDPRLVELHSALRHAERANRAGATGSRKRESRPAGPAPSMGTHGAARRLGVTAGRVRQLASAGRLPGAVRDGRDWSIPVGAIDAYRTSRSACPAPQ